MTGADAVVYIVDDDRGVCRSLQATLHGAGFVCRAFNSFDSFFVAYDPSRPGCLLLDIRMPGTSGLQALEELQQKYIYIPVIIITGQGGVQTAVRSLKMGASDYLEKPIDPQALVAAAKAAVAQDIRRRQHDEAMLDACRRLSTLSRRERALLRRIVAGRPNKLIADELAISIKTVINIRAKLMDKMAAGNMADLVRMAILGDPALIHADGSDPAPPA